MASVSAPPDATASRQRRLSAVGPAAAAYLAAHVPFLAPSLEDFDSINFALGLHDFDPARHQPHPPGSPVYVALARLVRPSVSLAGPALDRVEVDALTLALLSVLAGAAALVFAYRVFSGIAGGADRAVAWWATVLLGVSPLFWISGLRPMSDAPGLALALGAQALLLQGRSAPKRLVQGALLAGVAAGLRVQTVWLTLPLLCLAALAQRGRGAVWLVSRPLAACAAGALSWGIPLVLDSGGPAAYLGALGAQAGEDFAWVNMLWLEPTPRRLALALYETAVLPWGSPAIAGVVLAAAAGGAVAMLGRDRSRLALLLVAFAPYAAFHLLFQETITVRYALPTLPAVAYLAARGAAMAGRGMPWLAGALAVTSLVVALPTAAAYGREAHPALRAIAAASAAAHLTPPAMVYSHQSMWRALQAAPSGLPAVEPRRLYEWMGPVDYWKNGGTGPVWFLADARRTDLALIDPRARERLVRFRWAVADRPELSGTRPMGADWYRFDPPGWFAGEGWSLTPETGGLARATAAGPDHRPIMAWVRRRPDPLHLLVGGRHLGDPGDPVADLSLAVDGVVLDRWSVSVDERNFLRVLELPAGIAGRGGEYAVLTIASRTSGSRRAPVAVRQFDLQPADRLLYGFGEGWHEEELDPLTGLRWRWTSGRSVLQIAGPPTAVAVTLRGESPLRYFDEPPLIRVTAGGRVVGALRPDGDFDWTLTVPAADVARADGAIVIETDRIYLPGEREGTGDERRLGLRVYECRVAPVSP